MRPLERISQYQPINGTWTPSFYGYDGMGSVRPLTDGTGGFAPSESWAARLFALSVALDRAVEVSDR